MGKGEGLSSEQTVEALGYVGPARLVWGSWLIDGTARIETRSADSAPVGPAEGIAATPDGPVYEGCVGAFTADSGTEPSLLASLAGALGETYDLRWRQDGRDEQLRITVTARHRNRIHFETRD